jgi:hypothetical protein
MTVRLGEMLMTLKELFADKSGQSERRQLNAKTGLSSKVEIPGGNGFRVLREDILQKGLSRRSAQKAA